MSNDDGLAAAVNAKLAKFQIPWLPAIQRLQNRPTEEKWLAQMRRLGIATGSTAPQRMVRPKPLKGQRELFDKGGNVGH